MSNPRSVIESVALLAEPARAAVYGAVVDAGRAVSRDETAALAGVSRGLAAFHLDRLVHAGLLVAEYRRLSGRTGPGAGRPAKLYRRGPGDVAVSFPARHYEIPAQLFAETLEHVDGQPLPESLRWSARRMGESAGAAARRRAGRRPSQRALRAALLETLDERGYQPRDALGEIRLGSCPFHALVDEHRQLVCGMNLALTDGLLSGLGDARLKARMDPRPDGCCVAIGRAPRT